MPNSSRGNLPEVWRYYDRTESRTGYRLILGGTKHFGWYGAGDSKWRFGDALRRMEAQLAQRLDLAPGSVVLDAGCGQGDVSRALASRYGLKVEGIDILDFNLEAASRKSTESGLSGRTHFQWGDYHAVPFPDGHFDGVFTMETLVHASDPKTALSEFARVLRPGGRLVLFEYTHRPFDSVEPRAQAALEEVCRIAAMPAWIDFEDGRLQDYVKASGFRVDSFEDVTVNMLPMLEGFAVLGRFPYWLGKKIGKVEKTINAMSAVEMNRFRELWSYVILTATKA